MSEAADARGGGHLDGERIKVIGRFRPLEPGAEAAQWLINGTTLTYAMHGLKYPQYSRQFHAADSPRGPARSRVAASP